MKISLSLIDFLILALSLQGFVLAGMLFYSSKKITGNRWLAAFMLLLSYCAVAMEMFNSTLAQTFPLIYVTLPQLRLALGPILYFYTRSLLFGDKKLRGRDYLHFLPLTVEMGPQIAFIFHFSGLLHIQGVGNWYLPFEKLVMQFESGVSGSLPFFLSFMLYSVCCFRLMRNNDFNEQTSAYRIKDIQWLKTLLQVIFYLIISWTVTTALSYLQLPQLAGFIKYGMTVLAVAFAYWLGMSAWSRQSKMSVVDVEEYNKPPVKIHFSVSEVAQYTKQLFLLMDAERLFLDPALKLDILAKRLTVSEKLMSHLLNQHIGKNFNDFINEYRVKEAGKKLTDPTQRQFTIAAIAFDCGFNSLATFQRCFKQFTGLTPTQYQNGANKVLPGTNATQIPI